MSLDSLCRWQVQVSVYCAWRIPAHLRCTQCSILLHLMDICFLTCICLWQISQIQTFSFKVVGPGLVSTSPAFVSSSASHPAGPYGQHAQKNGKSGPHCWGRGGSTQFAQQLETTVTAPPLVGCVVWSLSSAFNSILHTFLNPVLITFSHHMSIPSQSTTSNESCDRLNSNQPYLLFICPSVFQ